ncbi:MAG: GGDEF domain-containing protein [Eubacteriales bacterium]|nr:GGDEF domain-containing protein [Eubacteriales bacterium]MDD3349229.1 GGDEF domain-containing protein [Eubacteriales bacterium]
MEENTLKQRLFNIVLKALIVLSAFSVVGNLITDLPLAVNIKWIFLLLFSTYSYFYGKYTGFSKNYKFFYILFLVTVFMPIGFVDAGGGKSDIIAYVFIAAIIITYLFDGLYRNILMLALILCFMAMHSFAYFFPEFIPTYDPWSRFIDRMIQIPILLVVGFLIIRYFANAYDEMNQTLFKYARYDELTGLLNKRSINEVLERMFDSGQHDAYLIVMDIDNFKSINDKRGHLLGDEALKHLSEILSRFFTGEQNVISRWGGDEFVIIFYGEEEELTVLLDQAISEFTDYIKGIEPLVGVSVGVSPFHEFKTVDDVFFMADNIMYTQKKSKK